MRSSKRMKKRMKKRRRFLPPSLRCYPEICGPGHGLQVDRAVLFKPFYAHWRMFLSCKKIYDGPENRAFGDGEWLEAFSRLRRCKTLGGGDG